MYLKGRNVQGTYTNIVQEHVNFLKRKKPLVSYSDNVFLKLIDKENGVNFFQLRITFETQ